MRLDVSEVQRRQHVLISAGPGQTADGARAAPPPHGLRPENTTCQTLVPHDDWGRPLDGGFGVRATGHVSWERFSSEPAAPSLKRPHMSVAGRTGPWLHGRSCSADSGRLGAGPVQRSEESPRVTPNIQPCDSRAGVPDGVAESPRKGTCLHQCSENTPA